MFKYKFLYLQLFLLSLMIVACISSENTSFDCRDSIGCITILPDKPIKLGVIETLSGGVGPNGTAQLNTIVLALDDRNNMLLGHPIELQVEDEECTGEGGANAALRILGDPQVIGILGTTCSNGAITVSKMMSEAGLVMVSGSNSAASLTSIVNEKGANWYPGYFRTVYNGAAEGRAAAIFAYQELGLRKAATINGREPYSTGLSMVFEQTFTELGGEIVLSTVIDPNDSDMMPVLTSVIRSEPEILFFPVLNPSSIYIIQQASQKPEFEDIVLQTVEGVIIESFLEEIGEDGVGVYFTTPNLLDTDSINELILRYEDRYGEKPAHRAFRFAYDATNLLLNAIEAVSLQDMDGTVHIPRQALRDELYATENFEGITGRLSCNSFGDCSDISFNVVQLEDASADVDALYANVIYTIDNSD